MSIGAPPVATCSFCSRPAIWHFGTERWQRAEGRVMGKNFYHGETIHTCGGCGLRLRRWADHSASEADAA